MGLGLSKVATTGGIPVFQTVLEVAQGGFTLDIKGLEAGSTLSAGAIMGYDEHTRIASVLKTAKVLEAVGATGTVIKVAKGSNVAVGENLSAKLNGVASAIKTIDAAHADYDSVILETTLGALTAGMVLFTATSNGTSNAKFAVLPKGLLYRDAVVSANETVTIVIRGTVYAHRVQACDPEVMKPWWFNSTSHNIWVSAIRKS